MTDEIMLPIPPVFHSLELGGPFRNCLICERSLLQDDQPYVIERIFRGTEPILEYAICESCHVDMAKDISIESMERIQAFVVERLDTMKPIVRAVEFYDNDNVEELIGACLFTGAPAGTCYERQIYAQCRGDRLVLSPTKLLYPMMISGAVINELGEVLSEATKGWMDDFIGEHFGMSPDVVNNPDWTPVLF